MTTSKERQGDGAFIETMDCLPVPTLPAGKEWTYEIKLDGYRLEAIKKGRATQLFSRRRNVLNGKFQYIADALKTLPASTIIDGELVALDEGNRSDFNLLQNFRAAQSRIHYYAFDILMHKGKLLTQLPLSERRVILEDILPINDHVSLSVVDHRPVAHMLKFVRDHGLEGVIAKRVDSVYEPGLRSGAWCKHRITMGQEFVVGGYTPGSNGFDALIIGVYAAQELMFSARVRAGFVPATRREVFEAIKGGRIGKCPFVNLPEESSGRWCQGLTEEKMKGCVWIKPQVVVRIDFLEWTGAAKLRHTKFVALRTDKDPRKVVRET